MRPPRPPQASRAKAIITAIERELWEVSRARRNMKRVSIYSSAATRTTVGENK
jgi:hypothetical protein